MIDERKRSVSESKKVDGGGGTVLEIVKKPKTPLPKSNHKLLQHKNQPFSSPLKEF